MANKDKLKTYFFYNVIGFFAAGILWSFALDTKLIITTAIITILGVIYATVMSWTIQALKIKEKDNAYLAGFLLGKVVYIFLLLAGVIWIVRIIF